jgi:hypothetical protein
MLPQPCLLSTPLTSTAVTQTSMTALREGEARWHSAYVSTASHDPREGVSLNVWPPVGVPGRAWSGFKG